MPNVYVNGSFVDPNDAKISVFDHGLVVGDGVFETILLHNNKPFALTRHLDRLARSASGLGLVGTDSGELSQVVNKLANEAEFPRGRIRITVTSGVGPLGSSRGEIAPTVVVAVEPADIDNAPCRVEVVSWVRNERGALAGLKTISYADNARALAVAHEKGASEAIFSNLAGDLCEGTGSNVFFVRAGRIFTPPLASGCLAGTTRDLLIEHMDVTEENLPIGAFAPDLLEEAFLASSIRGVQPIAAIGSASFSHAPGPATSSALECYAELLEGEIDP